MELFNRLKLVLACLLVLVIIWVALVGYLNASQVELKGEFAGFDFDYEYTLIDEELGFRDTDLPLEYYTQAMTPHFNTEGFEDTLSRIDEILIVPPDIFHALQSDAVIEDRFSEEEDEF